MQRLRNRTRAPRSEWDAVASEDRAATRHGLQRHRRDHDRVIGLIQEKRSVGAKAIWRTEHVGHVQPVCSTVDHVLDRTLRPGGLGQLAEEQVRGLGPRPRTGERRQ